MKAFLLEINFIKLISKKYFVSWIKGKSWTESVLEQVAEENIWTEDI
jgi:hypothetical protein